MIEARDVLRWGGGQHSFVFPETQFITVTAYQNNKVPDEIKMFRKWQKILFATVSRVVKAIKWNKWKIHAAVFRSQN